MHVEQGSSRHMLIHTILLLSIRHTVLLIHKVLLIPTPQVRCFDLANLALKFERCLISEVVDFQILSDDYSKAVFLCADRSLLFHARFGGYYK